MGGLNAVHICTSHDINYNANVPKCDRSLQELGSAEHVRICKRQDPVFKYSEIFRFCNLLDLTQKWILTFPDSDMFIFLSLYGSRVKKFIKVKKIPENDSQLLLFLTRPIF